MASLVSFILARVLYSEKTPQHQKQKLSELINNPEIPDTDRDVLIKFAISWLKSTNSNFDFLKPFGNMIIYKFARENPSLIEENGISCEKVLNSKNLNEIINDIDYGDSDLNECVELVLAKYLFYLFRERFENDKLFEVILNLKKFHKDTDKEFAVYIVNKLADIKINLKTIHETKDLVDRILKATEHWLNCEKDAKSARDIALLTELYGMLSYSETIENGYPSATVSSLLNLVSASKLRHGLSIQPTYKLEKAANVLMSWMILWPYSRNVLIPYIWLCIRKLAEERSLVELTKIAAKYAPQLVRLLMMPALQNISGLLFFLLIITHQSDMPLKQMIPELGKTVGFMKAMAPKFPEVQLNLLKLAGLCQRLVEGHTIFSRSIQDIFKGVQIPSEAEMGEMFTREEWFSLVQRATEVTVKAPEPVVEARVLGPRGLVNLGNTCYMNAILQALFFTPRFRRSVLLADLAMAREPLLGQLQRLFVLMGFSPRACITPSNELISAVRPPGFVLGHQEDCSEFLVYLLNSLHEQELGQQKAIKTTPASSSSNSGSLKRWTTEEDLSDSDPSVLLNGRRKARSLATFAAAEEQQAPPPSTDTQLTDAYSDSKDSGIHSVGSSPDMEEMDEDTLVLGIFGGRQLTSYQCLQCQFQYHTKDKFLDLQLALPSTDEPRCLSELLSFFLQPESLAGDNQYHCRQCDRLQDASKTISVEKAPAHLILTLKRFHYESQTQQTSKVTTPVDCPDSLVLGGQEYTLYAVVLHAGMSPHSGHYHSQVRCLDSDSWLWLNDECVTVLPQREWSGADTPYVLFYQQTGLTDSSPLEIPFSSLKPRLQSVVHEDKKQNNHQQPPPPSAGGSGCGDNLGSSVNRYVC